ncbi:hypothetical protein PTKIN_Ptkin02bG0151800 [Pterospermum kingtungense]
MNYQFLSELSEFKENQMIKIRIARLWDSINPRKGTLLSLDFVATDAKKNAMHVTIRRSDVEKFKPLLKEGALYQISRFLVSDLRDSHNSVPGNRIIKFIRNTQIKEIQDDLQPYPEHYFSFVPYSVLKSRMGNDKYMTGPVQNVELQDTKERADKQDIFIRELGYGDERIEVQIRHLDDAGDESRHTKEDNPEIKEVTIAKLLTFKPETIHNLRFSCQARVIDVDPSTGWFYNGCNQCLKSVRLHGEEFYCAEHGQQAPKLM